jgi:RimJ/RimL family protein N-acetyltransferase
MKMDLWKTPVIMKGIFIRLEPMSMAHVTGLAEIGCDDRIWKLMRYGWIRTEEDMRSWVEQLLEGQSIGKDLPFVVIHQASGKVAGASRYMEICPEHRRLEIGGTWYGLEFQRTVVNTECKYLLLKYAFEVLKAIRVQLKADARNERSWRAIERIGAKREGILRNHLILPDGVIRDSILYSITDYEWPLVRKKLKGMLKR